uniref:Chondroitin proteoglycan 4 domain-containing protein n=1 Tax=Plectus sambesii TaxID=2011161 RepID=A0A914VU48_9BILA
MSLLLSHILEGNSPTSPYECTDRCEIALQYEIARKTGNLGVRQPFNVLMRGFDAATVGKICDLYLEHKSCFERCSNDQTADTRAYQFMCDLHRAEFLNNIACYLQAHGNAERNCQSSCRNPGDRLEQLFQQKTPKDQEVLDATRATCVYVSCALTCAKTTFDADCPQQRGAGQLFYQFGLYGATEAFLFPAVQNFPLPVECRQLVEQSQQQVWTNNATSWPANTTPSSWPTKSTFGNIIDTGPEGLLELQRQLIQLQLVVLEKESRKLDVEMQKLQLELQVEQQKCPEVAASFGK